MLFLQPVSLQSKFAEDFTLSAGNLASLVDSSGAKAIVLSNPNNPTGRIHSAEEITALWEVARAREILLLIDESFSGVIFDHEKWRSSTCLPYQKLVVVSSFSKSHHLQGLRVGVALAHKELLDEMTAAHQTVLSATPTPSQAAVMAFLEGEGQPVDYRRQRRAALDFVHSQGWSCLAAEGSFYLFPRVAEVDAFHARAKERDVFVLRGSAFGACYTDHIRLCFGKPMAELEETFSALNDTSV
jgi:aspartate aminotransferase